jgi:hypothetical protein
VPHRGYQLGRVAYELNELDEARTQFAAAAKERHVSNLYDKLGVGSRRQAIVQATTLGLLPAHPH